MAKKFEYKVVTPSDLEGLGDIEEERGSAAFLERHFNALGADGWELVTITKAASVIFKRETVQHT